MPIDPQRVARKWSRRLGESRDDYIAAVQAQTVSPTEKAAAKKDTMRARVLESIDNGDWERGLRSVTNEDWKRASVERGAPRLVEAARLSEPQVQGYHAAMAAEYQRIKDTVRAMPNATEADREARWRAARDMMRALRGRGRK